MTAFRVSYLALFTAFLCAGCSTTNSSISSEDLRQLREKAEYLLKIDSANCTPDLIETSKILPWKCYNLARLNHECREWTVVLDSVIKESYLPDIYVKGKYQYDYVYDKSTIVTYYRLHYNVYDTENQFKYQLTFILKKDSVTQTFHCRDFMRFYRSSSRRGRSYYTDD